MNAEERRQFVRDHGLCVWGYNRRNDGPAMTLGYYVMDGDELCYLTMAARAKAKVARRDPRASICVLDMQKPPVYLQVYGTVAVETDVDYVVETFVKISHFAMSNEGRTFTEEEIRQQRQELAEWVVEEDRVVLRLTPDSTFYSPPTKGANLAEKRAFRKSLGDIEVGKMRVGEMLPW